MSIRPYGEYVTVRIVPGKYVSPLLLESKVPPLQAGIVEEVGPRSKELQPGDKVFFATGHLQHGQGKSLQDRLDRLDESPKGEELVLLKWFDVFFTTETFEGLVIEGRTWS